MEKSSTLPIVILVLGVGIALLWWWEQKKTAATIATALPPPNQLGTFATQTCAATLGAVGGGAGAGLCGTVVGAAQGSGQILGVGKTGGIVGTALTGPVFIGAADTSIVLGAVTGKVAGYSAQQGVKAAAKVNSSLVTAAKKEVEFWNW